MLCLLSCVCDKTNESLIWLNYGFLQPVGSGFHLHSKRRSSVILSAAAPSAVAAWYYTVLTTRNVIWEIISHIHRRPGWTQIMKILTIRFYFSPSEELLIIISSSMSSIHGDSKMDFNSYQNSVKLYSKTLVQCWFQNFQHSPQMDVLAF